MNNFKAIFIPVLLTIVTSGSLLLIGLSQLKLVEVDPSMSDKLLAIVMDSYAVGLAWLKGGETNE